MQSQNQDNENGRSAPPRGGRPWRCHRVSHTDGISIHALREEGDVGCPVISICRTEFLSTPSARRATSCARCWQNRRSISIHALREEGDLSYLSWPFAVQISIHALREEGDVFGSQFAVHQSTFLSTPSARRAT